MTWLHFLYSLPDTSDSTYVLYHKFLDSISISSNELNFILLISFLGLECVKILRYRNILQYLSNIVSLFFMLSFYNIITWFSTLIKQLDIKITFTWSNIHFSGLISLYFSFGTCAEVLSGEIYVYCFPVIVA